jgi:glycosyltransferase involved in cell wall biosynthesis
VNEPPPSDSNAATTGYVLCLTGMRAVNKRMALFIEGVLSMGVGVQIGSLPRGTWQLDKSERPLPESRSGTLTLDLGELKRAKLRAVMCFHWLMLPLAILTGILRRVPVLYDEHDHYELNTRESGGSAVRRWFSGLLVRGIHRVCLPFVTVVTCIHMDNAALKHHLQRWQSAVVEIHNYPTVDWRTSSARQGVNEKLCFVYIGGVFEEKGPGVAARALQQMSDVQRQNAELHIFGDGDKELLEKLRSMAGVVVHNSVTPAQFRSFAWTHRCCGLSLLADTPRYRLVGTNCTKLYEYLALGMPVIATRIGEFESFVDHNQVGLLVDSVFNEPQLSEAMTRMLNDTNLYEQMSNNARHLMQRQDMTWEHEWQKIETCDVLRSLRRAA